MQAGVFRVVAVEAERRRSLGQVLSESQRLLALAGLVRRVAGLASHVEGRVAAAVLGNIDAFVVAAKAEILVLRLHRWSASAVGSCCRRAMRIVALQAIANGRGMNLSVNLSGILVRRGR